MPILTSTERLGTRLAERYELRAILARGGMGVLYDAVDVRSERRVVVKLPRPADLDDESGRARFAQEAALLSRIRHPHVVEVLDADPHAGLPYVVMERLEGRTLAEALADHGPLDAALALEWLLPIAGAVAYAHDAGVLHRDLKPSNVFLHVDAARRYVPKLLDFGIAKVIHGRSFTHTGKAIGTPEYMSPEQAQGAELDARTDVFSLGAILYVCLAGVPRVDSERAPYAAPPRPLLAVRPDLPQRFAAAIERALSYDRMDRYLDVRQFVRALALTAAAGGIVLPADPEPIALPDFARWTGEGAITADQPAAPASRRRRRRLAAAAFGGALLAALLAAVHLWSAAEPKAGTHREAQRGPTAEAARAQPSLAPAAAQGEPASDPPAAPALESADEIAASRAATHEQQQPPAKPARRRRMNPAMPSTAEPPATDALPRLATEW